MGDASQIVPFNFYGTLATLLALTAVIAALGFGVPYGFNKWVAPNQNFIDLVNFTQRLFPGIELVDQNGQKVTVRATDTGAFDDNVLRDIDATNSMAAGIAVASAASSLVGLVIGVFAAYLLGKGASKVTFRGGGVNGGPSTLARALLGLAIVLLAGGLVLNFLFNYIIVDRFFTRQSKLQN